MWHLILPVPPGGGGGGSGSGSGVASDGSLPPAQLTVRQRQPTPHRRQSIRSGHLVGVTATTTAATAGGGGGVVSGLSHSAQG